MSDNAQLKAQFTEMWLKFADQHTDDMNIGDWLHLFGVMSGMSMALSHVDEGAVDEIVEHQNQITKGVYKDAIDRFQSQQTIQ